MPSLALPRAAFLLVLSLLAPGLAAQPDYPARITVERGGFTPEGIEYDLANERFLLGSVAEGKVFTMDAEGRLAPVVEDPDLQAVLGIEAEEERNRLLVVSADAAVFSGASSGSAALGVYALDSGERLAFVNLSAAHAEAPEGTRFFPNDVAVDAQGNAYVTDSFARVIYKVDPGYQASLFLGPERFPAEESLNGIAARDDYLVIAGPGTGTLYRVDLDDPASLAPIRVDAPVPGADGLVWTPEGRLAIASAEQAMLLESGDGWRSARVLEVAPHRTAAVASTVAAVGNALYVVFPRPGSPEPPVLERVTFEAE